MELEDLFSDKLKQLHMCSSPNAFYDFCLDNADILGTRDISCLEW